MARLVLVPRGNLGNQMLQVMFGERLAREAPGLRVEGHDLPLWGIGRAAGPAGPLVPSIRLQDPDADAVARLFREGLLRAARFRGVPTDLAMIGRPEWHRARFARPDLAVAEAGPDEILVNVRGAEVLGPRHPDYGPMPLEFYAGLVARTGLRPLFLGQIGEDAYSRRLRERFPEARFVPSQGVLEDWESIRRARHVVASVSTFSWLAAWLGAAETVHLPVFGLFNPAQRPDVWMLPSGDPRYRFHALPVRRWTASAAQVADLDAPVATRELGADEVAAMGQAARAARAGVRRAEARRLRLRAIAAWPFVRG